MSGEPQLERSVLEAKERDKLQAIADALGLKIPARAKKSDLIDGILRATGVEVAPPAEPDAAKPKRAPRRRATEAQPNGSGEQAVPPAAGTAGDSNGQAPVAEPAPGAAGADPEPAASVAGGPNGAGASEAPAVSGERAEQAPAVPTVVPQPTPPAPRPTVQAVGPPGPGNALNPPPPTQGHAAPAPHQAGQPAHAGQPGQPGQGAPAEGGELRRSRRRRGRDRDRAGYDQQAQQADQVFTGDPLPCEGLLELRPEGFGFLRTSGYLPGPDDVYVSTSQVRKFALRAGDRIAGASRPATTQERFGALLRIDAVGDLTPDEARRRPRFQDLTAILPDERFTLELADPAEPATITGRMIDLLAPLGKGQRGLVVAPPRAGASTAVKHIATAIEANHPDVELVVLLVDEQPEVVTDLRRSLKGEVIGSTLDRLPEDHTHAAELAVEVAKRRVELGGDVVVIVDGITRLGRAYNLSAAPNGRFIPDGVDTAAVHASKQVFGAGRNIEGGGSLTVVATVSVGTGSAVDRAIFEEVTGIATTELHLDRRLADRRMYPAVHVTRSSTSREELLLSDDELRQVRQLRRALAALADDGAGAQSAYESLLDRLTGSRTNADLLAHPPR